MSDKMSDLPRIELFDILMVFVKKVSIKQMLKKIQMTKKHANLPSTQ